MRVRVRAHAAVCAAVKRGQLANLKAVALPCEDCGERASRYDHRDYSKPLDVAAVCHRCNLLRAHVSVPSQQPQRAGLIRARACGRGRAPQDLADSHDLAAPHDGEGVAADADKNHHVFSG